MEEDSIFEEIIKITKELWNIIIKLQMSREKKEVKAGEKGYLL
jgi:hypothetical protein